MNYRHAFHAGNHGDVLKHAVLARILQLMCSKEKPLAFLDAHAGLGRYDLSGVQATKTGEWLGGVAKISDPFDDNVEAVLAPYHSVLSAMGGSIYPGSPEMAAQLLRPIDRLVLNELHPVDAAELRENYKNDTRVTVTEMDATLAVKASLPFRERRGVVLIDPPFEVLDEAKRTVQSVAFGHRRFSTGVFLVWYPVTTEDFVEKFISQIQALNLPNMLRVELRVKAAFERGGLSGSGLIIINPPWTLENDLRILLPALAARLGLGTWGRGQVDWLTPPK